MSLSRRAFGTSLAAGLGAAAVPSPALPVDPASYKRPVVISSANGYTFGATRVAYEQLLAGADTLDAVVAGVAMNENDPKDDSVGYGGLPNEEGVVQLDACVMHGPTMQCGAVGALENCKNAAQVAKTIMEHTDHIYLVGQGATRFARDFGFPVVEMLTDHARKIWLLWRETRSSTDAWGPGLDSPAYRQALQRKAARLGIPEEHWELALRRVLHPPTGTINCLAVNAKGEISGTTTTSGLAWKVPGRMGDSPVIGAGCYVDGEVGGGGSTGRGEENIRVAGGHTVVEMMRQGKSPTDACLEALHRVQRNFRSAPERLKHFDLAYYALRVDGAFGAATLWNNDGDQGQRRQFAVHDGVNRLVDAAYLLRR